MTDDITDEANKIQKLYSLDMPEKEKLTKVRGYLLTVYARGVKTGSRETKLEILGRDANRFIYKKAWSYFGKTAQMVMVMEECGELIVALSHFNRKQTRELLMSVMEEVGDVEIMCEQIRTCLLTGPQNAQVDLIKKEKIRRLESNLR